MKEIIRWVDKNFLSKSLTKYYSKYLYDKNRKQFFSSVDGGFEVLYKSKITCELARLCDVYGSDKGELKRGNHPYSWESHQYTDYYSQLFRHTRSSVLKVFECGLGTNNPRLPSSMGISGRPGASLRVWRDYFPNATVYGADIDSEVLFAEKRIQTFYIDQLNSASILSCWQNVGESDFDLIIDDGLHTFQADTTLFTHSINKLATSGIYVIEDVLDVSLPLYRDFFLICTTTWSLSLLTGQRWVGKTLLLSDFLKTDLRKFQQEYCLVRVC